MGLCEAKEEDFEGGGDAQGSRSSNRAFSVTLVSTGRPDCTMVVRPFEGVHRCVLTQLGLRKDKQWAVTRVEIEGTEQDLTHTDTWSKTSVRDGAVVRVVLTEQHNMVN
jgi:hypothetical protein